MLKACTFLCSWNSVECYTYYFFNSLLYYHLFQASLNVKSFLTIRAIIITQRKKLQRWNACFRLLFCFAVDEKCRVEIPLSPPSHPIIWWLFPFFVSVSPSTFLHFSTTSFFTSVHRVPICRKKSAMLKGNNDCIKWFFWARRHSCDTDTSRSLRLHWHWNCSMAGDIALMWLFICYFNEKSSFKLLESGLCIKNLICIKNLEPDFHTFVVH